MTDDLARLPQMIERAIAALNKATTAAEVLDVQMQAGVAYTAAKAAAQFARMKDAHDTVVAACRKVMGDALVIEARAQCRLADEYDAAQERGEVQKAGGDRKSKIIIPNENNDPTVTDIGLTSKQVHAARKVRDAEKTKPGIIRRTVEEKLQAAQEPTRAAINQVIEKTIAPPQEPVRDVRTAHVSKPAAQAPAGKAAAERPQTTDVEKLQADIATLKAEIAALKVENARLKETGLIDAATLPMTAQQKLAAALRQQQRLFEQTVNAEVRRRIDTADDHVREQLKKCRQQLFYFERDRGKNVFTEQQFRHLEILCHPDSTLSTELCTKLLQTLIENKKRLARPEIDYSKVEAAITQYAADRNEVRHDHVWKAIVAAVPAVDDRRGGTEHFPIIRECIVHRLEKLGFTASRSGSTFHRRSTNH